MLLGGWLMQTLSAQGVVFNENWQLLENVFTL